jgi:hypothetical protein
MRIVRWFVGSWVSRIYLVAVAVVTVWALVSIATWDHDDANFSFIYPIVLTSPVSLVLLTAVDRWGGEVLAVACVVVGALVNAAAWNGLVVLVKRARSTERRPDHNPQ